MSSKRMNLMNKFKLTMAAALLAVSLTPYNVLAEDLSASQSSELAEVIDLLQSLHISGVTKEKLESTAIDSILKSLNDPYTDYFSVEELDEFENAVEGQMVGIGVRISEDEAGIYINEVFADSPAFYAGLHKRDIITEANGASLAGKTTGEAQQRILGEEGTEVSITVLRDGKKLDFKIKRGSYQLPVVTHQFYSDGKVGYIGLTTFSNEADENFAAALKSLQQQGMKELILDLRDNGGGRLDTALNIASNFIKEGVLIHTLDKFNEDHPEVIENGSTVGIPVTVLVNEYSASASEALTGALQDYGVAKVLGVQSFGKGSVQELVELSTGSVLKVTIEEYLTPKYRKVNKVGITPDVEVAGSLPQLLSAFHQNGKKKLDLRQDKHVLLLNGVELDEKFRVIEENGKIFVPSRILSSLLGGTVSWNNDNRAVELAVDGTFKSYQADGPSVRIQEGISFLDVNAVAADFKAFSWSKDVGMLALKSN